MLMALSPTDSKPAGLQLISSLSLVIGYFTFHLSSFPPFEPHRHIGHLVFFKLYYCGFYFQLSLIFNHPKISHKGAKTIREFSLPFTFYRLPFTIHLSSLISQNFTQSRKAAKTIREFSLPFTVYFLLFTVYYSPLISHLSPLISHLSLLTVHRLLCAILFLKSGINFFHRNFNFFPGYPLVVNSFILLPNNFDKQ